MKEIILKLQIPSSQVGIFEEAIKDCAERGYDFEVKEKRLYMGIENYLFTVEALDMEDFFYLGECFGELRKKIT